MSFNAKEIVSATPQREILETGAYPARLVQLLNLGIQPQRPFKGEEKAPVLELSVTYELLDEFMPDADGNPDEEKPRWFSETFPFHSLKADRATSTKRYIALDQNMEHDGDWLALLGKPCMVNLGVYTVKSGPNTGQERQKILSVSAMRPKEAAKAPELVNEPRIFDFYNPDMEAYDKLPDWIQKKLTEAVDFPGSALEEALVSGGIAIEEKDDVQTKPSVTKAASRQPKQSQPDVEPADDDEENW